MATTTTNYKMTKPAGTDYVDIATLDANLDVIDAQMKANADSAAGKAAASHKHVKADITDLVIPDSLKDLTNDMNFRSITWSTVSIPVSAWSSSAATIAAAGMTADETATSCLLGYYPADKELFESAGIYCSAQGADSVVLKCGTTPTAAIRVNIGVIK